jgi:hypothetical protein
MSIQAFAAPARSIDIAGLTSGLLRQAPILGATAIILLAMVPPTLMAMVLDGRSLNGVNVWLKPLKFELSLALYTATLAWFANWLPENARQSRRLRILEIIVAVAIALEMIWIGGAAYAGIASHFNAGNAFMATIYPVMGALAITLAVPSLVYGMAFLRHARIGGNPIGLSLGLGLAMTFVLTLLVAGYMSGQTGHAVGASPNAGSFNLLGWSRQGGDLRVAHFFATHAMHFVPLFGFGIARLLPSRQAMVAVWIFSALFAGFVGYTFFEAVQGKPFLSLLMG